MTTMASGPKALVLQYGSHDKPVGLGRHNLGASSDRIPGLGETVVPVRVEIEQCQQCPRNPRAQQRK